MTLEAPEMLIKRDRWDRPYIIPPGKGPDDSRTAYTRVTTLVRALEDTYNLDKWQCRMVAKGIGMRKDLYMAAVAAEITDKKTLNEIAEKAKEAAEASAKATMGTALHKFCERWDRGETLPDSTPESVLRDVAAYAEATNDLTVLDSERLLVCDELECAGTPDRIVEYGGANYIADIKTGSLEYAMGTIAMQLAVYAHSSYYDPRTGERSPLPSVSQDAAIVIWLPEGMGKCELVWVNIAEGWPRAQLALDVREWRKVKTADLSSVFRSVDLAPKVEQPAAPVEPEVGSATVKEPEPDHGAGVDLLEGPGASEGTAWSPLDAIRSCKTMDELTALWFASAEIALTPALGAAAAERAAELEAAAEQPPPAALVIGSEIANAQTTETLTAIWAAHQDEWTEYLSACANQRIGEINARAAASLAAIESRPPSVLAMVEHLDQAIARETDPLGNVDADGDAQSLANQVAQAVSRDELTALWQAHGAEWDATLNELAAARIAVLETLA